MSKKYSIQAHVDALNRRDLDGWEAFWAPDAVVHDPSYPDGPLKGRAALRRDLEEWLAAFPDVQIMTRTIIEEGNLFAFEGYFKGTHTGPLHLPDGQVPPTNRTVESPIAFFGRSNDHGESLGETRYLDVAGVLRQLGLME